MLPNEELSPAFLAGFANGQFPDLGFHLGANSFVGSDVAYLAPGAKVMLFHYSGDTLVPAQNTTDMIDFLNNGHHSFASVERGDCHEDSAFVKLLVGQSRSEQITHSVCGLYFFDRIVETLP